MEYLEVNFNLQDLWGKSGDTTVDLEPHVS